MLKQIMEVLLSGISLGAIYGVNAMGLSLVYGTSRVFNFAYGSFFTWGAYMAWLLMVGYFKFGYPLTFVLVIPVMFLAGMAFERGIIRPLRWRSEWQITTMIVTLGMSVLLDNVAMVVFGPLVKVLPPLFAGSLKIGIFNFSKHSLGMLVLSIMAVLAVDFFINRHREGAAIRAVSQDMTGAQIVGIPVNLAFGYAFGISAVMAGVSGILLAPIYLISPLGGWTPFVKSFVIVILGGLGSIRGTLYSAFILGIVEALVCWYFGSVWTMAFWFVALLGILIVRPKGLFGTWA